MPEVVSSNPGQGKKFTKVMGSDGNCKYLPMFSCPMLSMRSLRFMIVLYKLRHVWCEPSACIAAA